MFSRIVYVSFSLCSLILQGHAHGGIVPMLGVKGTPARGDVQRPSTAHPCGNINPATSLDSSQAAMADAQDRVNLTAINFNAGADGSRKVTAEVSADGTGNNFTSATVPTNGDAAPTNVGPQPLVVQLPVGTKCTGGKTGNICLMSLKTTSGFGNCVAIRQAGASNAKGAMAKEMKNNNGTTNVDSKTMKGDAVKGMHNMAVKGNTTMCGDKFAAKPAGARAVRSAISSQERILKRSGFFPWIWA